MKLSGLSIVLEKKISPVVLLGLYFNSIGVVYSIAVFSIFGLNYADYATISDFLFASFKEPLIFVVSVISVFVISLAKFENPDSARVNAIFLPHLLAGAFGLMTAVGIYYGDFEIPFSNTGAAVSVNFKKGVRDDLKELVSARLVGRAGKFYVLYDLHNGGKTRSTIVIPEDNIAMFARVRTSAK